MKIKTIKELSTGIYKEKGSKFIAYAYPINKEEDVLRILKEVKKEHHSARHHCYAYSIGAYREKIRYNDDGEPNGTAGKPIINQIVSFDLTNVLVVVVRYFGGILLGTGGLTHAYKIATFEALKNAIIIELENYLKCIIHCNYQQLPNILKILNKKENNCRILNQDFDQNHYIISIIYPEKNKELIKDQLSIFSDVKLYIIENFLL